MHGFINLKTFVRMQNLAFVHTYTFRMKSTESFINETPGDSWASSAGFFENALCGAADIKYLRQ